MILHGCIKEYWMIDRRPGFLAVVWFGSSPTLSSPPPVSKNNRRHTGRLRKRDNFLTGEGERGGGCRGAESCDRKKAWSSKNHSILSGLHNLFYAKNGLIWRYQNGANNMLGNHLLFCSLWSFYPFCERGELSIIRYNDLSITSSHYPPQFFCPPPTPFRAFLIYRKQCICSLFTSLSLLRYW